MKVCRYRDGKFEYWHTLFLYLSKVRSFAWLYQPGFCGHRPSIRLIMLSLMGNR